MKRQRYLNLLIASSIVLGATPALSQSSNGCSPDQPSADCSANHTVPVETTTTPPETTPSPPSSPQTSEVACQPNGPILCGPPLMTYSAATPNSFFCGKDSQGNPATFISTPQGIRPFVKWVSHYFAESGYTPATRCKQASNRFDMFYRQGRMNYITTGTVNRQPVICVAGQMGGSCTGILFTLKPEEDANRVIQQLFYAKAGKSGPLLESGERQYIDVNRYIQYLNSQQP